MTRFRFTSSARDAERACAFVADHARKKHPHTWLQGARKPAFSCETSSVDFRLFAEYRVRLVSEPASRALVEAAHARRPLHVLDRKISPRDLLAMQARGERCVSILDDGNGDDPLEFALHDLCHLEKFVDEETYAGQVGFFDALHRANLDARFDHLDLAWRKDLEHVSADMNGSPVFLFAALKMKLKMAARRDVARHRGTPERTGGVLDSDEARAFEAMQNVMFDALALPERGRLAGDAVSARRDSPDDAMWIHAYFTQMGERALEA
ncbi:MAG: hypothetical protein ACRELY_12430 [Polyangiaceae bacterium]